jgi:hypothetical protein
MESMVCRVYTRLQSIMGLLVLLVDVQSMSGIHFVVKIIICCLSFENMKHITKF